MQPMIPPRFPVSSPVRHVPGAFTHVSIDGEFLDDEMPPELFDEEEDLEDLAIFIHLAEDAYDE